MRLAYNETQVQQHMNGVFGEVIKNDLTGAVLVLQGGTQRISIRLADIASLIAAYKEEDEKNRKEEEQKNLKEVFDEASN